MARPHDRAQISDQISDPASDRANTRLRTRAGEAALTRRRQALGLLLLAGLILLIAVLRAPAHTLFPTGWWRF